MCLHCTLRNAITYRHDIVSVFWKSVSPDGANREDPVRKKKQKQREKGTERECLLFLSFLFAAKVVAAGMFTILVSLPARGFCRWWVAYIPEGLPLLLCQSKLCGAPSSLHCTEYYHHSMVGITKDILTNNVLRFRKQNTFYICCVQHDKQNNQMSFVSHQSTWIHIIIIII